MEKVITVQVSGPRLFVHSLSLALNTFPDIAAHEAAPQVTSKDPGDATQEAVEEAVHVAVLPALRPADDANASARWRRSARIGAPNRPLPAANVPPSRVVAIVSGATDELTAAADKGYQIFISIDDDLGTIRQGILAAALEEPYCSPLLARKLARLPGHGTPTDAGDTDGIAREMLTLRQRNVATLAAAGFSNAEIASKLSVSVETVRTHLKEVYIKLGIGRRGQIRM